MEHFVLQELLKTSESLAVEDPANCQSSFVQLLFVECLLLSQQNDVLWGNIN
jgi:hypothetical protein